MTCYHAEIDSCYVAEVVHGISLLFQVIFDPVVETRYTTISYFSKEDVFKATSTSSTSSAVVQTQPDKTQVLFEHSRAWISQIFNNYQLFNLY